MNTKSFRTSAASRLLKSSPWKALWATTPGSSKRCSTNRFYAFRHASAAKTNGAFWHATRRVSEIDDDLPTEVFLSLVNLSGEPAEPNADSVTVRCICTNANLASKLPVGNEKNENGDFQLEGFSAVRKIVALRRPSPALQPPLGKATLWKLVSHLSLNYLSLVENGKEALQEILSLYNFSDSAFLRNQINGIVSLKAHRQFGMVTSEGGVSLARGTRVEMELNEDQFAGGGAYLFCSVLERFLGLYASLNSFSQLSVTTLQRKEALAEWQPRSGSTILASKPARCKLSLRSPLKLASFRPCVFCGACFPAASPWGDSPRPPARLRASSLIPRSRFPASEIQELTLPPDDDSPATMKVNFMGLSSPQGVLPTPYTELIIERTQKKDNALRDFLDLFNHRLISFFYRAWEKHHFFVSYELG